MPTDLTEAVARALCKADADDYDDHDHCKSGCIHPAADSICPFLSPARAAILETLRRIREPSAEAVEVFYRAFERELSVVRWEGRFGNGLEAFIDHLIAEIGDE